jgi:hypothetical protein
MHKTQTGVHIRQWLRIGWNLVGALILSALAVLVQDLVSFDTAASKGSLTTVSDGTTTYPSANPETR